MVLSVARAGTLLATVVCMTNILYNMVPPLGVSGDPYLEMVRDACPGMMPHSRSCRRRKGLHLKPGLL